MHFEVDAAMMRSDVEEEVAELSSSEFESHVCDTKLDWLYDLFLFNDCRGLELLDFLFKLILCSLGEASSSFSSLLSSGTATSLTWF